MSPNATKYTNKIDRKVPQNKIEQVFWGKVQDCKDGSGLRLIFDQDVQKSKLPFWWNFEPFLVIFPLSWHFLLLPIYTFFFSYCKKIKRNFRKLQAILFQAWQCPFNLTFASDSISRVSRMTRAEEWSFGVGAVGVSVTVVCTRWTLVDILAKEQNKMSIKYPLIS